MLKQLGGSLSPLYLCNPYTFTPRLHGRDRGPFAPTEDQGIRVHTRLRTRTSVGACTMCGCGIQQWAGGQVGVKCFVLYIVVLYIVVAAKVWQPCTCGTRPGSWASAGPGCWLHKKPVGTRPIVLAVCCAPHTYANLSHAQLNLQPGTLFGGPKDTAGHLNMQRPPQRQVC